MKSWMALLVAGMLLGPVAGSPLASADTSSPQAAVDAAYVQWESGLGVRRDCSSGASVVLEEIEGRRGEYRTDTGQVVIDPTDGLEGIEAIVHHELSHHTFLACEAFADAEFTQAFYAAQGIAADRDWFDHRAGWSRTPAEHFAEAMAVVIGGSRESDIVIAPETIAVVIRWLAGTPVAVPTATGREPMLTADGAVAPAVTHSRGPVEGAEVEPPPVAAFSTSPIPSGPSRAGAHQLWRVIPI